MTEPIVIPPGGGEVVGDAPSRRVEILSDHESLHATWSRFGPGRDGADLHVHHRHTDLFYVLDGELTVRLGPEGEPVVVPAGTLARVPPLVVHGFRNASRADVHYLNLHAPGRGFARFLRDGRIEAYDQHPPPPDGGRSPADAVVGPDPVVTERPRLRVALLTDVDEIAVAEVRAGAGREHVLPAPGGDHAASVYVLDGELAAPAGGRAPQAGAGTWLQVPAGGWQSFAAAGTRGVRFLLALTPNPGLGAALAGA